jgi:asparagine synthetase B (glutamine-hydrolysing)
MEHGSQEFFVVQIYHPVTVCPFLAQHTLFLCLRHILLEERNVIFMSAIAGILDLYFSEEIMGTMMKTMRARGAEGKESYCAGNSCILNTNLSVSEQTMILDHGNVRYIITYDGVLYNKEELRQELSVLGHSFDGNSDTEILLHGYVQWKEKLLE